MTTSKPLFDPDQSARQKWLRTLALSPPAEIDTRTEGLFKPDDFEWLRQPETGLYRLQGRLDGEGDRFNLSDMTVTRCALRAKSGSAGVGYVAGRAAHHSAQMARLDALLQDPAQHDELMKTVIEPLAKSLQLRHHAESMATAKSRVSFYTLSPETT